MVDVDVLVVVVVLEDVVDDVVVVEVDVELLVVVDDVDVAHDTSSMAATINKLRNNQLGFFFIFYLHFHISIGIWRNWYGWANFRLWS